MKMLTPPQHTTDRFSKRIAHTSLMVVAVLIPLSSCSQKDPSYEKEALKLTAENAALKANLEEAERNLQAMQAKLNQAQSAVANANQQVTAAKGQITEAKGKIDAEKIKLGFAKAVSGLGEQIEKKHPEYTVESVTFQKMKMPTDYPFSSGVVTTLISKNSGKKQNLYWEAQGNTQGVWRFAQRKKPTTSVAQNTPTNNTANNNTAATPPKQPSRPAQPVAQPPRRPVAVDGNTHIIDWGRLK
ncbi:MAG: hypothetical protein KJO79_05685 [Verrucomicrobiae bacterium]|nr:hypothetical protein [Verrucomicrobiae bacterium]NNJ86653.1 hypothetical protein [Akkermansiaceae bacterium]